MRGVPKYFPSLCSNQATIFTQYAVFRVSRSVLQMEQLTFIYAVASAFRGATITVSRSSTGNCRSLCDLMSRSRSTISDDDTSSRPEMCLIALSMRSVIVLICCAVSKGLLLSRCNSW